MSCKQEETFSDLPKRWITEEPDYGPMMEKARQMGEHVARKREEAVLDRLAVLVMLRYINEQT